MKKYRLLMVIVFFLTLVSVSPTSLDEMFSNDDSGTFLYSYKDYVIFIVEESILNPKITARMSLSKDDYISASGYENLNLILKDLIYIAKEIDNAKTSLGEKYENIYVYCDYAFRTQIILEFKNGNLYLPRYYNDISYILKNFKTTNEDELLSNEESFDFLYYNGFLNSGKDKIESLGVSTINSGYSVFIVDGKFKSYNRDESKVIKLNMGNAHLKESDLISKEYKSYWGEGDWLVSKKYDDFSDNPIFNISQSTSSSYDRANVWLNIRYTNSKLEIYIDFSTNVSLEDSTTITYRIDNKETVYNEKWMPSVSKKAIFYPLDANDFLIELMDSNKVVFLVKSKDNQYKFEIDTWGLEETIKPLF